ncbi:MAG: beta-glucosidase [Rhodothermales bacterium]|jgi:beta-glucosidase
MTLREKAGQMTQVTLHPLCDPGMDPKGPAVLDMDLLRHAVVEVGVGSIFNVAGRPLDFGEWRALLEEIQRVAVHESRLGIPIVFGLDAVHGSGYTKGATLFPQNLALAASFRPELSRAASRITAQELAACGVPWNFSPVLDVGREPLWSRFVETFGEDVHLTKRMGTAAVQGHQDVKGVAACAKHFLGYSAPATGRDRTTAWIPDGLLRDIYLPPFKAAVDAGVETVMVNSGDINGEPVHASRALLTDLLKIELGFDGVVVTDWEDVIKLHLIHRVAPSVRDAVRISVMAGIDMSMTPYEFGFADHVVSLVEAGELPEARVDDAVGRILLLKERLGLFEAPLPTIELPPARERIQVSQEAAAASLVLLENRDAVLPLGPEASVAIVGPGCDSAPVLSGPWSYSWQGSDPADYPEGSETVVSAWDRTAGDRKAPELADVIVLCLAEKPTVEKPGDINDLRLDDEQQEFARGVLALGKPVIAVLLFDRPRVLGDWIDDCAAVIWAGRPGPFGAEALVKLLQGSVNPSGKLPFTYPRSTAEVITYDHRLADELGKSYGLRPDYAFDGWTPRWRFGAGLSYTSFGVEALSVHLGSEGVKARVALFNKGDRAGREVIQAYVQDHFASVAPRVERLAAFQSVELEPGQRVEVEMDLDERIIGFHGKDGFVLEKGMFSVRIGDSTEDFELPRNMKSFS